MKIRVWKMKTLKALVHIIVKINKNKITQKIKMNIPLNNF
jgi:hypothetical protein